MQLPLTKNWISEQIKVYQIITSQLGREESDIKLFTIYHERINTLQSVLVVLNLEMRA
jgi:hypothetical protein